jgi:endonuclease/exonuclease/phosphatase family metal-dependent hydrolase
VIGRRKSRRRGFGKIHSALVLCLLLSGCANVSNFTDPKGPGLLVSYAPKSAASPKSLRVVTFNIKFAREIDKAIGVLRDTPELQHADFIALQEMDDRGVDRIAQALSMNAVYYAASIHPSSGKPFGPALLSRWPIERGWKLLLPHQTHIRAQRRVATAALVRVGTKQVRVYALHLEAPYRLTERDRWDQARAVIDDARTWGGPVIVVGDMNDEVLGQLFEKSGYTWVTKGLGATMGPLSFDHVFTRDLGPVLASGKADAKGASDHRPVWAEVIFPPVP